MSSFNKNKTYFYLLHHKRAVLSHVFVFFVFSKERRDNETKEEINLTDKPFPPKLIFTLWISHPVLLHPACCLPTPLPSPSPHPVLAPILPFTHPVRYHFPCSSLSYLESTCKPSTTAHTCLRDDTRARTSLDCSSFAE